MSSQVVISPDRFVQNFTPGDFGKPSSRAKVRARRHEHKEAQMCGACMFGRHELCQERTLYARCTCICRED